MTGERCNISIVRRLRDVANSMRDTYKTIVISSPFVQLSPDLAKDVVVIDFGLPGKADLGKLLDRIVDDLQGHSSVASGLDSATRQNLLQTTRGLTLKEAENVFAKSLVLNGKLDATTVAVLHAEKRQIIRQSGLLDFVDAPEGFENVAGLANLKRWLLARSVAFTPHAAHCGLPMPRGVLLLGAQGCGKSLCAKAIAGMWKLPLLRLDLGRLFGSLVGASEQNIRRALETVESIAPAVLWIDEIDKGIAGSWGLATSDGGTSARVVGTFTTWLSERTAPVFVVATANNVSHLPPELLRKGRFDEIFFVDLPSREDRTETLRIHLKKRRQNPDAFDISRLSIASEGFSGAEIEEAINAALFEAFSRDAALSDQFILDAISETVPLSRMMSEEIEQLRSWGAGRTRLASGTISRAGETRRNIEL